MFGERGRADDAEAAYRVRNGLLWTLLAVHAVGVIDAAVFGGVPADVEQRYRDRIGVGPVGAGVGAWIRGRY